MHLDISHLRVIITAGGQGLGKAMAAAFHNGGARVWICDIVAERLEQVTRELPGIGTMVADVSEMAQVDTFIDTAVAAMDGVDVMINNAGVSGPAGPLETLDPASWSHTIHTNLTSMFYCLRRVIPHLKAQRSGSIINIASTAGVWPYPNRTPYTSSKWAVVGLTKTLAMELGEYNVRVNVICPGSINNPRMDHVIRLESEALGVPEDEIRSSYFKQVTMQTFIDPEEIAALALFICSPLGAKISGQALSVDGNTETLRT